jgi:hypothetical protein
MVAVITRSRFATLAAASALAVAASLACPLGTQAGVVDVWTSYPSMNSCKTALLNLTGYCYGLQDGTTLGLIDASFAVDELDQSLGIDYDDENVLPAPEGRSNPVVEVWNNTDDYTFLAAGASLYNDAVTGVPIYYVAPHADDTWSGPPLDATQAQLTHYGFSQSLEEIRPTSQQESAATIALAYDLATRN